MVDQENGFVLVDGWPGSRPVPGRTFFAFGPGGVSGTLRSTEESRPPFAALEILQGLPAVGDRVALDESRPVEAAP